MRARCVFVVDGSQEDQILFSGKLQTLGGMIVYQFQSAVQLLSSLKEDSDDEPDLIIMDEQVPGMSGSSIIEKLISAEMVNCTIILLTDKQNNPKIPPYRQVVTLPKPKTPADWDYFMQRIDLILIRADILSDLNRELHEFKESNDAKLAEIMVSLNRNQPKTYADVLHRVYTDIKTSPGWATFVAGTMVGILSLLAIGLNKLGLFK